MGLETLAIAAIATSVIGTGVSAYSSIQAGKAQNRMAQYNANEREVEATTTERDGRIMANAQRAQNAALLARQRTLYAKSGVTMAGTPLLVQAASAMELEKEALNVQQTANTEANRQRRAAILDRMEGKSARRAGTLNAVGTILSGASSAAAMGAQFKYSGVI